MAGATAAGAAAAAAGTGAGSPCGACKFLRRRCVPECVFAPYFSSEQGAARFAAIHKVFGASNASKLLSHLPVADRCEAVVTITYEAQARLRDPVYGCVAQIFALQQQVLFHFMDENEMISSLLDRSIDRSPLGFVTDSFDATYRSRSCKRS